eukprot:CAMPEP_0171175588 /NCGR_PEP_ID=MMETSP0790-20130122/11304_1 /TAXON_ID=2925 /ORGANISM="Alexandrium catenella, Strain OF101" /LENGTH=406 /DNA_ID=CAMNT_0011640465 /DNA_START=69 /DNA_END=1287 /DNA_ORIENTATION=+
MPVAECRPALLPRGLQEAEVTRRSGLLDPRTPHFGRKTQDADAGSNWGTESTAESTDAASTGISASGDELLAQAPASSCEAPPGLPSAGSVLHSLGECEPCAWFWKPQGCMHGQNCFRCHLCSSGEIKKRKAAKLVARRAQVRSELFRLSDSDEDILFGLSGDPEKPLVRGNERRSPTLCAPTPEVHAEREQVPPPQPAPRSSAADAQALGLLSIDLLTPLHQAAACRARKAATDHTGMADADALGLLAPGLHAQEPLPVSRPVVLDPLHAPLLAPLGPPPGLEPPSVEVLGMGDLPSRDSMAQLDLDMLLRRPKFSVGSASHGRGACEPCAWYWKPQGCQNGQSCTRCHLCPMGSVKQRKAQKKAAMRTAASALAAEREQAGTSQFERGRSQGAQGQACINGMHG